jgi:hypothetical protein
MVAEYGLKITLMEKGLHLVLLCRCYQTMIAKVIEYLQADYV